MTNALYELALNPDIQDKLRQEIKEHLAKHNGEFKYENMKDMKYLDKVYKETLRKYPPGGLVPRRALCPYTFRDTKLTIPKRLMLWIPIFAIHRDPDNYPNPDVFNPENFSDEAIEARHPMTFLPFGGGPRNCIGGRFADCQTKVGLVTILRKYKVNACEKTMIPYEFEPTGFLLGPKGGIYLRLTKLEVSGIIYCLNYQSFKYIGGIMVGYFEILCGVVALFLAFYYYSVSAFDFWKSRGVRGPKPVFFFGNTIDVMFARIPIAYYIKSLYEEYKNEPMVGLYMRRSPVLILKDPELIKDVMIKDFVKFSDRGFTVHERTEPLSLHLFNLEPKRWRPLRSKLTPMFTSGKLKDMFGLILECADHFEKYLDKLTAMDEPADFREVTAKYTTDVIGSCAFGIEMSSMSDKDSEFRKVGREIFGTSLENVIRLKMRVYAPKLYDWLGYIVPDRRLAPFFTKLVTDTMRYRKEHDIYRPDFIHMLMQLKEHPEKLMELNRYLAELTDSLITAQAFVFFAAGFETSSSTMSNALYELALNQEIQEKLRDEIKSNLSKHGGELKYEHVKDMEYLDKVFKGTYQTLRKYPPGPLVPRRSTSDYTFTDTKVSIPKDLLIWIPVYAIHRDPDIYPNPDVFNPENFNEDAIQARHPMTYLPFGDGPRNCIGARFAVYQTKVGLITILRKYKVVTCEKTMIPYQIDSSAFLLAPKGGIYLKLQKLNP
ncbi:unnamed protein product, partial [Heterotrigona itama]